MPISIKLKITSLHRKGNLVKKVERIFPTGYINVRETSKYYKFEIQNCTRRDSPNIHFIYKSTTEYRVTEIETPGRHLDPYTMPRDDNNIHDLKVVYFYLKLSRNR